MIRDNPIDLNKVKNALAGVDANVTELDVFAKMSEIDFVADKKIMVWLNIICGALWKEF